MEKEKKQKPHVEMGDILIGKTAWKKWWKR